MIWQKNKRLDVALTPGETEWLEPVNDEIYNSL